MEPASSRRTFVRHIAAGALAASLAPRISWGQTPGPSAEEGRSAETGPWYRRCVRWGQTNLTEIDPLRFDLAWWRKQWRETAIDGVVVNAGGIVAYYPTEIALHRRALHLGKRDLFGEIRAAAKEDGLAVFARMDSNRADQAVYDAHPDWFTKDAAGKPYRVTGLYVACVNGPYYTEHIPAVLREVASKYRPEGFTDNNWNGATREQPCFCDHCQAAFAARSGKEIPRTANWDDPTYREWIRWNYDRRIEIWDTFNEVTRSAGGADCIWVGMMAGSQSWQAHVFRDDRRAYQRADMVMLDHQRRFDPEGLQHNALTGRRIHCVGGWGKLIPESMAMYHLTEHNFRLAAKPEPEVRLWFAEGVAGGIQPWWHHVGSDQQDRRALRTAAPLWKWHRENEAYLLNRRPVANVGLIWSQRNMDFYGRDDGAALVDDPWNGMSQALIEACIPHVPVHVDDLDRVAGELGLTAIILPNIAVLSQAQVGAIRRFHAAGGGILATGHTSLCDEEGQSLASFALEDVFGIQLRPNSTAHSPRTRAEAAKGWAQTYLRLHPELRGETDGPRSGDEPRAAGVRHPVLAGFEDTDILAFGGLLDPVTVSADSQVLLTYVPPVPVSPAEAIWMPTPRTDVAGLVVREGSTGGRTAFLAADVDRRFARDYLPDHGRLLANLVRWVNKDNFPLKVEGAGLIDAQLWRQPDRLILHLVNLNNPSAWRTPVHSLVPTGPVRVELRNPFQRAVQVRSLVTGLALTDSAHAELVRFEVASIRDHDVLVIEPTSSPAT